MKEVPPRQALSRLLSLAELAGIDLAIELGGFIARYAERLPAIAGEVLGEQDYLAHMVRIVRELAVDSLHDGVCLAADRDSKGEIGFCERLEGGEDTRPAVFPIGDEGVTRGRGIDELAVAIAVGLFAVSGEEVGPA